MDWSEIITKANKLTNRSKVGKYKYVKREHMEG